MTRHLPRDQLAKSAAAAPPMLPAEAIAAQHFRDAPFGQMQAALAALYRFRPDIGVAFDPAWHERHMILWPRDDRYFLRLCRLLKAYGVGDHHGGG